MTAALPGTTEKIIAAAERRMREGGFHGFSFREIAADVGIKSASVHHHFPTKEDLATAATRAYTDRFMAALGEPGASQPADQLAQHRDLFRQALIRDRQMCLCGVLGSEASDLPPGVRQESRVFFQRNIAWLDAVLRLNSPDATPAASRAAALRFIATLEGAMLLAHALGDTDAFDSAVGELEAMYGSSRKGAS